MVWIAGHLCSKIKGPCPKIFKISTSEESYAKNMNIINLHSINVWFKDKSSTIEELRISSVQRWLFYIFGGEQFVILWKRWSPLWDEEDENLQVYLNLWKRHKYPKIGRSKTLDFGRVGNLLCTKACCKLAWCYGKSSQIKIEFQIAQFVHFKLYYLPILLTY